METNTQYTSCSSDDIKHGGRIVNIDKESVTVSIITKSACVSCQMNGACNFNEIQEEQVEVPRDHARTFKVGEQVNIAMKKSNGTKAVFLGYILPFLVLLVTLFVVSELTGDDGIAGLAALGVLIPYYLILYLQRDKLKKTFVFHIE